MEEDERMEWSTKAMIRLLDEYRKRRVLWCRAHPFYREPATKYEAWSDLATTFECPLAEIRKKLNSIFASYRREKIKIRHGGKTTWFLYDYLKFLPNHVEPPPPAHPAADSGSQHDVSASSNYAMELKSGELSDDNEDEEAVVAGEEAEEEEEQMEEHEQVIIKEEPSTAEIYIEPTVEVQAPPSPPSPPSSPAQPRRQDRPRSYTRSKLTQSMKRRLPRNHDSLDSKLLETLKLLKKSELSRKKDECDSFGEYIAMSLRKHDECTQSMIKQAINNILFEQEMRLYSAGQYTVVLTGAEEDPLIFEAK